MKFVLYILVGFLALKAQAVTLDPIGELPEKLSPGQGDGQALPCDQILPALLKFQDRNRQHEDGVVAFLTQANEKIGGWYEALFPLEGQTKLIEAGTFEPIRDGAEKMSTIVDYSYDNTALLAQELDRIIVSMRECQTHK